MIVDSIGPNSRPFQPARRGNALREEDEFMALHGGRASRLIYQTVVLLEVLAGMPGRVLTRLWGRRDRAGPKRLRSTDQPACARATASAPAA